MIDAESVKLGFIDLADTANALEIVGLAALRSCQGLGSRSREIVSAGACAGARSYRCISFPVDVALAVCAAPAAEAADTPDTAVAECVARLTAELATAESAAPVDAACSMPAPA